MKQIIERKREMEAERRKTEANHGQKVEEPTKKPEKIKELSMTPKEDNSKEIKEADKPNLNSEEKIDKAQGQNQEDKTQNNRKTHHENESEYNPQRQSYCFIYYAKKLAE